MSNTRDDDVGRQYNVFQHQHQVTVAQRPHHGHKVFEAHTLEY